MPFKIDFDALSWESLMPHHGGKQIRIVEFTYEFVEPHRCEKGHFGFVISV